MDKIANCISRKIGILSQIRKFAPESVIKLVYNSIIQPHLTYGIALWGGVSGPGMARLNKLQNKAIRIITGASRMDHSEPRLKKLGILRLNDLYSMQVNCLTYDCLYGTCLKSLFRFKSSTSSAATRSHTSKPLDIELNHGQHRMGPSQKHTFAVKAIQLWNDLPSSIQNLRSKKEFKNILKRSILNKYKSTIACQNPLCADIENCRHV